MTTTENKMPERVWINIHMSDVYPSLEDLKMIWNPLPVFSEYVRADLTPVSAEDLQKVRDAFSAALKYAPDFSSLPKTVETSHHIFINTIKEAQEILDRAAKAVG